MYISFWRVHVKPTLYYYYTPLIYYKIDPFEEEHINNNNNSQKERETQRVVATTYIDSSRYEPIRVQFDTHLLDALLTNYAPEVSYVRNILLPSLKNFWSETLSIIPANKIEIPLSGNNAKCANEVKQLSGFDLDDFLQYDTSTSTSTSQFARSSISNIGTDGNVELNI